MRYFSTFAANYMHQRDAGGDDGLTQWKKYYAGVVGSRGHRNDESKHTTESQTEAEGHAENARLRDDRADIEADGGAGSDEEEPRADAARDADALAAAS
jgi:hypothetical protein